MSAIPKSNAAEDLFAFQSKAMGLPPCEREYLFAQSLGRKFRADFAWPEYRLLAECQGGIWRKGGGAHSRPTKLVGDIERQQYAALLGFIVLPFTPDEVFTGHAVEWTERTLKSLGWKK